MAGRRRKLRTRSTLTLRRSLVMAVQLVAGGKPVREQVSAAEWTARVELAAGHRVLAHYGVNDLTYNHFGLRVPGEPDHMLIKRTDWMFSEVTASSLLKVDRRQRADRYGCEDDQGRRIDHSCRFTEAPPGPQCDAAYPYSGGYGGRGAQIWPAADQSACAAILWRGDISRIRRFRIR